MSKTICECVDKIKYCDLSIREDDKLSVIASLMLGFSGEMDEKEIRRLGEIIEVFLVRKKALDSFFLSCSQSLSLGVEIDAELSWVKSIV